MVVNESGWKVREEGVSSHPGSAALLGPVVELDPAVPVVAVHGECVPLTQVHLIRRRDAGHSRPTVKSTNTSLDD